MGWELVATDADAGTNATRIRDYMEALIAQ
jgi:hypothetical protein